MSYEDALAAGNSLMEALGVTTAEEARAVPAEDVVAAYNELGLEMNFIVDDYYLADDPLALIEAGEYTACPVLLGVNEGEINNIGAGDVPGYPTLLNASTAPGFFVHAVSSFLSVLTSRRRTEPRMHNTAATEASVSAS